MIRWGDQEITLPYVIDSPTNRKALHDWYTTRPKMIQEMIDARPMGTCYVMHNAYGERGHYTISSYSENKTVKILHGADSFFPGVEVFGVNPQKLWLCGCGNWEPPTRDQIKKTHQRILKIKES